MFMLEDLHVEHCFPLLGFRAARQKKLSVIKYKKYQLALICPSSERNGQLGRSDLILNQASEVRKQTSISFQWEDIIGKSRLPDKQTGFLPPPSGHYDR